MQQLLAYFSLLWSGKTTLKKIKGCISYTEEPLQINFALVSLKIQILCRCFLRVFLRTSVEFREKLQSSSLLIGAKTFEQWEHRNGAEGSVRK